MRAITRGQGLAEYALLLLLVFMVCLAALVIIGGQVSTMISTTGSAL